MRLWPASTKKIQCVDIDVDAGRGLRAPAWLCSLLAGSSRERRRLGEELATIKGAWPLLMKQRRGGTWTHDDRQQLRMMVRSASSVSPYLVIWVLPGSVLLLPFVAWYLDTRRQRAGGSESGTKPAAH